MPARPLGLLSCPWASRALLVGVEGDPCTDRDPAMSPNFFGSPGGQEDSQAASEERVLPAHVVSAPREARVQELNPGSTCARPRSSSGFGRARWSRPGAGLGGPDASTLSQGTPIRPRRGPRVLTWQPQLRESVAHYGRGLPAPRRAAGAPGAGSS